MNKDEKLKKFEVPFGKYAVFSNGKFYLNEKISELLYRKTELICSYSGSNEWCNHMICELIDLYSGSSPFNYALNSCKHEEMIPKYWTSHSIEVVKWFEHSSKQEWYRIAVSTFNNIIESIINNTKIFLD